MTALSASSDFEGARLSRFLADWSLAPRQFRERFLDSQGWSALSVPTLVSMSASELDAMIRRWKVIGALPAVRRSLEEGLPHERRPKYLDDDSVAEMMRGMFWE